MVGEIKCRDSDILLPLSPCSVTIDEYYRIWRELVKELQEIVKAEDSAGNGVSRKEEL